MLLASHGSISYEKIAGTWQNNISKMCHRAVVTERFGGIRDKVVILIFFSS